MLSEGSQRKQEHILYEPKHVKLLYFQNNFCVRNEIHAYQDWDVIGQGHERTFWDDANILCFSESMSFAGTCIYQDIKHKICLFYYM